MAGAKLRTILPWLYQFPFLIKFYDEHVLSIFSFLKVQKRKIHILKLIIPLIRRAIRILFGFLVSLFNLFLNVHEVFWIETLLLLN